MRDIRPAPGDHKARHRVRRSGREKGGHIYIPADLIGELSKAPALWYTLGGNERGRVIITLYTEP